MKRSEYHNSRLSLGFTLLEVLIALVILAVGTVAVIQLQSALLDTARKSEQRAIAYSIADAMIEDLRNYQSKADFYQISSSSLVSTSPTLDYGNSGAALTFNFNGSVVNAFDADGVSVDVASDTAKYKEIELRVNWNESESITLNTIIGLVDPALRGYANAAGDGAGGATPDVDYQVGDQPDVIPIQIGDGTNKESTRPLPEVSSKGGSTEVSFQAIRYTPDGTGESGVEETLEDYVSVNCTCEYPSDPDQVIGSGLKPAYLEYNTETQALEVNYSTEFVSKAVATPYVPSGEQDQSFLCTRCCRDHHDGGSDEERLARWYWPERTANNNAYWYDTSGPTLGDHEHFYNANGDTNYVRALPYSSSPGANKLYVENCRFRRVDGIYRLMQDWRLVDLTVLPSAYVETDAGLRAYQNYFVSAAASMLASAAVSSDGFGSVIPSGVSKPTSRDYNVAGLGVLGTERNRQLQVRATFVDPLPSTAAQSILAIKEAGGTWLDKVPIVEVNYTLLAEWASSDDSTASVTAKPVKSIEDPDNYLEYDGNYSRGLITTGNDGSATITATAAITNTGVVGHRVQTAINDDTQFKYVWTDSIYDPLNTISDSIEVVVSEAAASESTTRIAGTIECYQWTFNDNDDDSLDTYTYSSCAASKVPVESINISVNGTSCASPYKEGSAVLFACDDIPITTQYDITFAASGLTYTHENTSVVAGIETTSTVSLSPEFYADTDFTLDSASNPYTETNIGDGAGKAFHIIVKK